MSQPLSGGISNDPQVYWMRKWRVLVIKEDGKTALDVSELRVVFRAEKNVLQSNQKGSFKIYNCNPQIEKDILANGKKIYLEAGYDDGINYGQCYSGDIIQIRRYKENSVDFVIDISALSDNDFLNWGIVGLSARRGTNYRELIEQIGKNSSPQVEVGIVPEGWGEGKISRGIAYFGHTSVALRDIAKTNNCIINLENGKMNIISLTDEAKPEEAFKINARSGMIGTPMQTYEGVNVRSLLNPRITLGGWLMINNADIIETETFVGDLWTALDYDGLYRIIAQVISGDTRGNDWYIDNETITQAGKLPVMLQDPAQNGI